MKHFAFVPLFLASMILPAQAQWVTLGSSDRASIAIDTSSIKASGSSRFYWTRLTYFLPEGGFSRIDSYEKASCNSQRVKPVTMRGYNLAGQLVEESPGKSQYIVPGTLGSLAFEAVCSQ